ncbi:amino acid permease [Sphaerulina musiva SO2202]|uniref:Amino acid permease n=1 Tax=Sphaerulina musiva (strain SO2202) TaxID=692275 RepID=M3DBG1_SPHMS|nr:amino acid permease [Sphaerulina musiva SO2202]EMF15390.1 amino acid permease [Sphaerulina musiva SO2202]
MSARRASLVADGTHLAALGVQQELKRNFSPLSMLGLAFAILNSWTALSTSMSLALPSGGPVSVIWGLVTAGIFNLCLATSLAEFLSAYPTAGGQYHWVHIISWPSWKPLLSWITGWINVFGWMALTATGGLLGSQIIIGIIAIYDTAYVAQRWHQFLIYIGYNIFAMLLNAFGNSILPLVNKTAIIWSITGFVVISITVLACASPDYSSGDFVYRSFINETGWPDGVAWLLGLLQGSLGLTGYDATAHMIEEIPNAAVEGPKIMIYCVAIGAFTGFVFLSCLLFVAGDINQVIESSAGPLNQIIYNATGSKAGMVCLLIFPLVCLLFATISIMTTSSRMTYAFARDGGLPFSRVFARVHQRLDVPLESLGLTVVVVLIFGCVFLGSTSAFNAITSASVVALGLSYGIPIMINCLRGRKQLPPTRTFILPEWFGWTINLMGIAFVIVTTVLFVFPPELPVTGSNMNYCIVAFAIVFIISLIQWFVDGRKNYTGPKANLEESMLVAINGVDRSEMSDNGSSSLTKKGADV